MAQEVTLWKLKLKLKGGHEQVLFLQRSREMPAPVAKLLTSALLSSVELHGERDFDVN